MSLHSYIVSQFKQPRGLIGKLAGNIMARRPSNIERNRWIVDLLNLEETHHVLEIGCGPGLALKLCADQISAGHILGIDHSEIMVRQAHARLSRKKVELRQGNLDLLPEYPSAFDRIFSINVVQFFPDIEEAFGHIYNSLKPEGMVVTAYQPRKMNMNENDASSKIKEIENAMKNAGFSEIKRLELPLKPIPVIAVQGNRQI